MFLHYYCSAMTTPLMILIAGPYRSGTGDDPALLARNLARLEQAAWPIFRAGHLPMIGEWVGAARAAGAGVTDVATRWRPTSCTPRPSACS